MSHLLSPMTVLEEARDKVRRSRDRLSDASSIEAVVITAGSEVVAVAALVVAVLGHLVDPICSLGVLEDCTAHKRVEWQDNNCY